MGMYMCIHVHVCGVCMACVCACACMCMCVHVYVCACICACVSVCVHLCDCVCVYMSVITLRAHARSGVKQWVLSASLSVCHQNFGLITTTKGLNVTQTMTIVKKQCMVYLKVAEAVLFARISSYLWP